MDGGPILFPTSSSFSAVRGRWADFFFFCEIKLIIQLYKKFNHNIYIYIYIYIVYNLVHKLSITAFEL